MTMPYLFIDIDPEREATKPRASGLTMVVDQGVPFHHLKDGLEMAGAYVDIAKIKVGSSRIYPEGYLERKIATYRDHDVDVFPGGQFLEYAIHKQGLDISGRYFAETARVGYSAVEISDNVVTIPDDDRLRMIEQAHGAGLKVFSEVGAKHDATDVDELIRQAQFSLDAGAELVLVEAAEFVDGGTIKTDALDRVTAALDMKRVMLELPGPWIPTVTESLIEDMKKALIRSIGPNVNIGNVATDMVMELEVGRIGLGAEGPPGMHDVG